MSAARKLVVIGVDGASPEMVSSLSSRGLMPNLQGLASRGSRARLESTVPPHSGPAWISAITGKNPGKHGVFFFTTVNSKGSGERIVSSADIRTDTVFDTLGRHGKRSVSLNVPLTYPPWEINGVLVSGMFTPSVGVPFTCPSDVGPLLAGRGYEVEFSAWDEYGVAKKSLSKAEGSGEVIGQRSGYLKRVLELDSKNVDAFLYLTQGNPWDMAMVVLTGLDRIQHLLWRPVSPEEEHKDGKEFGCSRYVVEAYQAVDAFAGRILEVLDKDTWVIIFSDHGFGPTPRIFYINKWLESAGLLSRRRKREGLLGRLRGGPGPGRGGGTASAAERTADSLTFHGLLPASSIDMDRTAAYAPTPYGLLNLGLPAQARSSTLESLMKGLEAVNDSERGRKVLRKVRLSSDVYSGPFKEEASDILLEPDPDYYIANGFESEGVVTTAVRFPASHKPEGILLISGPEVKGGYELPRAHIYDIAPTVLRILGVPLPRDMDGRPLDEALQEGGTLAMEPVAYAEAASAREDVAARVRTLKEKGRL